MKTISLILVLFIGVHASVLSQVEDAKLESGTNSNPVIEPGTQLFNTNLLKQGESSYKISVNSDGEISASGTQTNKILINEKSKTITRIQIIKTEKEETTDSLTFQMNTLVPVYHSIFSHDYKLFLRYSGSEVSGEKIFSNGERKPISFKMDQPCFDAGSYDLIISTLPAEKLSRTSFPVYDYKSGNKLFYTIQNLKDEATPAMQSTNEGTYIVDVQTGKTHSRLFMNKNTGTIFKIENDLGGPIITISLVK